MLREQRAASPAGSLLADAASSPGAGGSSPGGVGDDVREDLGLEERARPLGEIADELHRERARLIEREACASDARRRVERRRHGARGAVRAEDDELRGACPDVQARLEGQPLTGSGARRQRREIGERLDAQRDDHLASVGRRLRCPHRSAPAFRARVRRPSSLRSFVSSIGA